MANGPPPSETLDQWADRVGDWIDERLEAPPVIDLEVDGREGGLPIKDENEVVVKEEGVETGESPTVIQVPKLPPALHWEDRLDILDDWIPVEAVVNLEVEEEEELKKVVEVEEEVEVKMERKGIKKHF